jgi:hypothetical protein
VAAACECVYSTGKVHFSADRISLTFEFSPSRGTAERFIFYFTSTLSLSLSAKNISLVTEILRGAPLAETYGRVLSKLSIL